MMSSTYYLLTVVGGNNNRLLSSNHSSENGNTAILLTTTTSTTTTCAAISIAATASTTSTTTTSTITASPSSIISTAFKQESAALSSPLNGNRRFHGDNYNAETSSLSVVHATPVKQPDTTSNNHNADRATTVKQFSAIEGLLQFLADWETVNHVKYVKQRSFADYRRTLQELNFDPLYFIKSSTRKRIFAFTHDGIPYLPVLRKATFYCQYGADFHKNSKQKYKERVQVEDLLCQSAKKRRVVDNSYKLGCPSVVKISRHIQYTSHKLIKSTRHYREMVSKMLKNSEESEISWREAFTVEIPSLDSHKNHPDKKVSTIRRPTATKPRSEVKSLTQVKQFETLMQATQFISHVELKQGIRFLKQKSFGDFEKSLAELGFDHSHLREDSRQKRTIRFSTDGVPYVSVQGNTLLVCQHYRANRKPGRRKNSKHRKTKDGLSVPVKHQLLVQHGRKPICPAVVKISRHVQYPSYRLKKNSRLDRQKSLADLRSCPEHELIWREAFIVEIPSREAHRNHFLKKEPLPRPTSLSETLTAPLSLEEGNIVHQSFHEPPTDDSCASVKHFSNAAAAFKCISDFEERQCTKYIKQRSFVDFSKSLAELNFDPLFFTKEQTDKKRIFSYTSEGIPYLVVLRKATLYCQHGNDYHRHKHETVGEYKQVGKRMYRSSCKVNCPAVVKISRHIQYISHKLKADTKHQRLTIGRRLRHCKPWDVKWNEVFIVELPSRDEHKNHPVGENSDARQPVDPAVLSKLRELVRSSELCNVRAIRQRLVEYVETELFKDRPAPPNSNRRYYPLHKTVYNHVRATLAADKLSKAGESTEEVYMAESTVDSQYELMSYMTDCPQPLLTNVEQDLQHQTDVQSDADSKELYLGDWVEIGEEVVLPMLD